MPGNGDEVSDPLKCPICGGDAEPFCSRHAYGDAWQISKCGACRHGFVSNRPSEERLAAIYATEAHLPSVEDPTPEFYESRRDCRTWIRAISKLAPNRGRSLDVGCGDGGFSYHLQKAGFTPHMIDLDPRAQRIANKIPGASFGRVSFEDLKDPGGFDVILMSQVLEHSLDPLAWLVRARDLLSERGLLAIGVPNFGGIYRILGKRDPFIIPPIHLNYFTPRSLHIAMTKAGLKPRAWRHMSTVNVTHPTRKLSLKRRVVGHVWNLLSVPVDWAGQGIILCGFASRGDN
jgi:2-polyprenyl-3-methyl-5-hydroxy-6-metoxy-1,4-benzoquinol methylase